jgi:DNA-binding MarR family transcriptional regulator
MVPAKSPRPAAAGHATDAAPKKTRSPYAEYEQAIAAYTAAGGQETVQRVVTALSRLNRRLDVFYRQQFEALDISPGEWGVLQSLAAEGPAGSMPSQLADVCGVSPSTMTHRLDRMVERGLIERDTDPDNRTRMRIRLTDNGAELFRRAVLDAEVVESSVLSPLDDRERRQLATLLDKVVAGLRHSHH